MMKRVTSLRTIRKLGCILSLYSTRCLRRTFRLFGGNTTNIPSYRNIINQNLLSLAHSPSWH